jgi:polyisoprenoid-binding protein YceI
MSMKKIFAAALAFAFPLVFAAPAALFAAETTGVTFRVDPQASTVKWLAKKVTGQHNGVVPVDSGEITVVGGALTGGLITIATAKLKDQSLNDNPTMQAKLQGHLNSPDFFDTAKYPTSTFKITSVKKLEKPTDAGDNVQVTGDLTIKDKTNPLTFPAKIEVSPTKVTATAKNIAVDRTAYDIRYGSGKFFQGLGDKVINDNFWIDLDLVATK